MGLVRNTLKKLVDYENPNSLGSRFRAKRIAPLIELIDAVYEKYGHVDIIDIGGTKKYWKIFPRELLADRNVTITIVNLSGAVRDEKDIHFRFAEADGCDLSDYEDNSFHIAYSNSVIEHVGPWDRIVRFSNELSRVARSYIVQPPYYWFPVEPHFLTPFFHWLPRSVRIAMIMRFNLGHYDKCNNYDDAAECIDGIHLLDKKMFSELFNEARIITERVYCCQNPCLP